MCKIIMQYNDCILALSFDKETSYVVCKPEYMINKHMVRGHNEKIYFLTQ